MAQCCLGAVIGGLSGALLSRSCSDRRQRYDRPAPLARRSSSSSSAAVARNPSDGQRQKIYGLGGFCTYHRVFLCMVGLPARGKSYITNMLVRYLGWTGFPVKIFNAGSIRRQDGLAGIDAKFFGEDGATSKREQIATQCMEVALAWLETQDDIAIAIFDATNTTKLRRNRIRERCSQMQGITPLFVESICDDPAILEENYRMKLGNDDYKHMDPVQARMDFEERVKVYEQRYETLEDNEGDGDVRYIKVFNVGQKVVLHRCDGYAPSHIGFYLSNIHITPRRIWLVRHANTADEERGVLGTVSDKLTETGVRYCRFVADYIHRANDEIKGGDGRILVYMGTAPVHNATYSAISGGGCYKAEPEHAAVEAARKYPIMSSSLLNELDGGDYNGMSRERMMKEFPEVIKAREEDKLNFRYPGAGGESYVDVINRLRPVIVELERHTSSIIIISHLAVQRCIYAYFTGCSTEELPYLDMDMHTVFELNPGPFGTQVKTVPLNGQCVSNGR